MAYCTSAPLMPTARKHDGGSLGLDRHGNALSWKEVMSNTELESTLLFGLVALNHGAIDRSNFLDAVDRWLAECNTSFPSLLVTSYGLSSELIDSIDRQATQLKSRSANLPATVNELARGSTLAEELGRFRSMAGQTPAGDVASTISKRPDEFWNDVRDSTDRSSDSLELRIDAVCDRFEQALKADPEISLDDFLAEFAGAERVPAEQALLDVARELRGKPSTSPSADENRTVLGETSGFVPADLRSSGHQAAGMMIGPYRLVRPLGRGGFGSVWLAERAGALATTQLAIKFPINNAQTRVTIQNEARSWVRVTGHPNVVPIIEADEYGGTTAIVSEFVDGGTLQELIGAEGPLAIAHAVELLIGILCGLEFLHARRIIHRDLKPGNILLQHGLPRLTDFGLARHHHAAGGEFSGTPRYMSPEAFRGENSLQSDLWAAAVILFEMLTGKPPFAGKDLEDLYQSICQREQLSRPDEIPISLWKVIRRAFADGPEARYLSATDMKAAMIDIRKELALDWNVGMSGSVSRHMTVAITGSMRVDPDVVRTQLRSAILPYLSPLTTWYVGSNGAVDEAAIELLIDADQQVFLVGYDRDDLSPTARRLVTRYDLPFIDPHDEPLATVSGAPSHRDSFFLDKADLVFLIWDGFSQGTQNLRHWLASNRRDHAVVFV